MGLVADRVKETTTSTGNSDVVLAGAVSGFRTFNDALGQQVLCYYALLDANGTAWETGSGYLSSSTNFKRANIYASSNANAAITLTTGTHTIFCSLSADVIEDINGKIYATARGFNMP